MTITARAREIITQSDAVVVQTVRFFNDAVFVKDAPIQYAPGKDQATAVANLTATVKGILARGAADSSTVAVIPATMLDLTDPVAVPPTQAQLDQAAYFDGRRRVATIRQLLELKRDGIDQSMLDAAIASWNALRVDLTWEGLGASK